MSLTHYEFNSSIYLFDIFLYLCLGRRRLFKLDLTLRIDWYHFWLYFCNYIFPSLMYLLDLILCDVIPGSYMVVDSSDHDPGERARLQLPTMKENDTHCIDFSYLLYSQKGLSPGTLNILVRVNKGPLANPIWNVTGSTGRDWLRAELAVSTFWPNEYQVIICSFLVHGLMSLDLTVYIILGGKF